MYKKTRLNNGLTVVTHQMPSRVSVSVGIWLKVGSRYEAKEQNGIAHFLEHLLFKGTAKRSCDELKQSIEGIGGSLNGFTSEEITCYLAKVPGRYIGPALDALGDMVLNARLDAPDIEMERRVILEEIRMYKDLPAHFVMELLTELLWPGHPLGRNIAGETDTVGRMQRQDLLSFKQHFYQPDNMVVVCCGNLKHQDIVEQCAKYISAPGKPQSNEFSAAGLTAAHSTVKFQDKDIEQTHLALGLRSLARNHPERYCLGLLHVVLGANMSSRLFHEVREKRGLAYAIGTSVKLLKDTGAFIVHAGVDNKRVALAFEVILEQLEEIKKNKITQEELKRAKEYYLGQLSLSLEDTAEHMLWLGEHFVSLNKFIRAQEVVRKVKKITAADLAKLANDIFTRNNLHLALIGPLADQDKGRIQERLNS
ncbi:MAG: insulinase family protein [Candidatus Omnitrophica bacterium]|nr:insulinase family protein [Candidatus Omnitrophota bacterium]